MPWPLSATSALPSGPGIDIVRRDRGGVCRPNLEHWGERGRRVYGLKGSRVVKGLEMFMVHILEGCRVVKGLELFMVHIFEGCRVLKGVEF